MVRRTGDGTSSDSSKTHPVMAIDFDQIDIVAHDMAATLAFYRGLGVEIPDEAIWRTSTGIHHVDFTGHSERMT